MDNSEVRIIFMGTPEFAVAPLEALIKAGFKIVGIVTAPDKPAGRGKRLRSSAVKEYAASNINCPVFQPEKLKDEIFAKEIKNLNADIIVVVAFRMLPEKIWSIPAHGTINLHASLLPQYRGAAPINWCIINGEKETGVSTFMIDHKIDTGGVLFRESVTISPDETAGSLHDKLMAIGSELIVKTVEAVSMGQAKAISQKELLIPEDELKTAPKIFKDDCRINWDRSGMEIARLIRGLSPFPTAWTMISDESDSVLMLKIFKASFVAERHTEAAGTVLSDKKTYLKIAVTDGYLELHEIQQAGKKRMLISQYLHGLQKRPSNWKVV